MPSTNDLYHLWGGDLATGVTGDLLPVADGSRTTQRILRRLLTNPGEYIWHPTYGAGLPARVGDTFDAGAIAALIRGQILLEPTVAPTPEPDVSVTAIQNGMSVSIRYTDALTNAPALLSFDVTA